MKKRFLVLALAAALCLSITACSQNNGSADTTTTAAPAADTTTAAPDVVETTPEETDAPAETLAPVSDEADLVLKKGDMAGLKQASDNTADVKDFIKTSYGGVVGGEDNGQWLVGGDNCDIGITKEMLEKYTYLEVDFTIDQPVEGVTVGLAFKAHVNLESRTCEDGGYIFADYLPATWVPYGSGADKKQPIMAVNSLDTIYQTGAVAEGTMQIPVADLLAAFPEDFDYIMGIGFGANNNGDGISDDDIDNETEYVLDCTAIRLTNNSTATNVCPNLNK